MIMKTKKIHFMGVGGAGCSAAFAIAAKTGYEVSGCDKEAYSSYLDKSLKKFVSVGHDPSHIKDVDLVAYSPAIVDLDPQNPELLMAGKKAIEVLPWDKFVGRELLKDKFVIAVAGTHGKGTVAAMISAILEQNGFDPTCLLGVVVERWGTNYRVGKSKYFVIEADEYSEKFLNFPSDIGVVTNIDFDHPDYFKDLADLKASFAKFIGTFKDNSILIIDSSLSLNNPKGKTVKSQPVSYDLKMIGRFNKMNAGLALEVGKQLGISEERIKAVLENFTGLKRRFEFKGEQNNILVFDDYAHHPTAVTATLVAAREKFPDSRLWVVFQPHLYSRTKLLFKEFVDAFEKVPVDKIILVDIYGAREKDTGAISSSDLTHSIKNKDVKYLPTLEEAAAFLAKEAFVGDVIITLGAGDIYKLPDLILKKITNKI